MNYLAALGEFAAHARQSGDGVSMTGQAGRTYKISEFAAMTGMSSSKVRFYEKAGLFCANEREENGYRVFTPQDAFRANAFRVLLQYGFTVEHAIEMLDAKQDSAEFEGSLRSQRETLQRQIDLLNYRLRRIDGALDALEKSRAVQQNSPGDLATGSDFELADIDDQVYVKASKGYDFSVSSENRQEIAAFYELLSVTNCARILHKEDLLGHGPTIDPSYVICMPAREAWRLESCEASKIERLPMGKCLRYHRRLSRSESLRRETFDPLFAYLANHGYRLRSDVLLLPMFMNLDGRGSDVETLLVPIE